MNQLVTFDNSLKGVLVNSQSLIPLIGLGTYPLVGGEATAAVQMAIELGCRHIDTAQMYGNERSVGAGISASGMPRSDVFLVTKVDPGNLSAGRFEASVKRSIDDLGGPPDLLLVHWPPHASEVDAVIDRLIAAKEHGQSKFIGISNHPVAMMRQAQIRAAGQLVCNQVEFHPLLGQGKVYAAAQELGMQLTAYSPLARGAAMRNAVIQGIAERHGRPASEIVLRWIVQQGVAAIPMSRKRENIMSNLSVLSFALSEAEMAEISRLGTPEGRTINPARMSGLWDR
jgi:diketogulonate reductase-like aldo/keto reductase